ncbi:uncharacterized protein LOC131627546 [Vicia villosa]|uniref:uncharacterized protein LOC131627546 n=1 Tax=Vicia villosa TaxID=3911 RepID=UPI00273C6F55|nr:uncharacterized protein LOC131627546 [Vicia villosa]
MVDSVTVEAAVTAGRGGDSDYTQHAALLSDLLSELQQRQLAVHHSGADSFGWRKESSGVFSVSSCYKIFKEKLSSPPLDNFTVLALSQLWNIKVPSKILFFGWRCIINKLATKDLLVKRGILREGNDARCVLCLSEDESHRHLFVNCVVTNRIWRKVYDWVGVSTSLTREEFVNFFHNCDKIRCVNSRVIRAVVWLSTAWNIWLSRNAVVFKSENFSFLQCWSDFGDC